MLLYYRKCTECITLQTFLANPILTDVALGHFYSLLLEITLHIFMHNFAQVATRLGEMFERCWSTSMPAISHETSHSVPGG